MDQRNKDEHIGLRLSAPLREAVEELARVEAVKFSEALRMVLRDGLRQHGLWPPKDKGE